MWLLLHSTRSPGMKIACLKNNLNLDSLQWTQPYANPRVLCLHKNHWNYFTVTWEARWNTVSFECMELVGNISIQSNLYVPQYGPLQSRALPSAENCNFSSERLKYTQQKDFQLFKQQKFLRKIKRFQHQHQVQIACSPRINQASVSCCSHSLSGALIPIWASS